MREDAVDVLPCHLVEIGGVIVEAGNHGVDGGAGFCGVGHVAQVNAIEGGFAHAEDKRAALLERDIGCSRNERVGEAVGDGCECAHGAGKNDHSAGGVAAAGDTCADVFVAELDGFFRRVAEEFFEALRAATQLQFLRHNP